tara:strand:+ start:288 stop:1118 length:831 start_codon:yes stop_codon:yes gene_type:complete
MKNRHNKKRNTAFVYEALIKEATAAILKRDHEQKEKVINVIKKYFNPNCILSKDLDCYRALYETKGLSEKDSRRIIEAATLDKRMIDPTGLFKIQSQMINDINKEVNSDIFSNFVPNYKTLATIDQLFSVKTSPTKRIMLENEMVEYMTTETERLNNDKVDHVVVSTFIKKFNDKYSTDLLEEQKTLLSHYISSFTDNSLELKIYLNNEISRLKADLSEARKINEIKEDKEMLSKLNEVIKKLDSYSSTNIDDGVLLTVLKTQNLTKEIFSNAVDN